jgi:hypothetical protein
MGHEGRDMRMGVGVGGHLLLCKGQQMQAGSAQLVYVLYSLAPLLLSLTKQRCAYTSAARLGSCWVVAECCWVGRKAKQSCSACVF